MRWPRGGGTEPPILPIGSISYIMRYHIIPVHRSRCRKCVALPKGNHKRSPRLDSSAIAFRGSTLMMPLLPTHRVEYKEKAEVWLPYFSQPVFFRCIQWSVVRGTITRNLWSNRSGRGHCPATARLPSTFLIRELQFGSIAFPFVLSKLEHAQSRALISRLSTMPGVSYLVIPV